MKSSGPRGFLAIECRTGGRTQRDLTKSDLSTLVGNAPDVRAADAAEPVGRHDQLTADRSASAKKWSSRSS
jgi:hypothetical protein